MKSSQKQHKKCTFNDHNLIIGFHLTLLFDWKSQLGWYYCKNRKKGKCEELLKKNPSTLKKNWFCHGHCSLTTTNRQQCCAFLCPKFPLKLFLFRPSSKEPCVHLISTQLTLGLAIKQKILIKSSKKKIVLMYIQELVPRLKL